ncbi:MAG TPA: DUF362 domain-containing protein [Bryobacteraceae bacterium]|jgi:uncharacterized protein (DUF362 family)|nr:DUF362 domain-containing protein [Bryobacteraceae bacterium]
MDRRTFLAMPAAAGALPKTPEYRVVSAFQPSPQPGMPGPYAGSVVSVKSAKSIDAQTENVDAAVVAEMIRRGMTALTGEAGARDAWRKFFTPSDVVGIKVNCSGAPGICSHPAVVAEIVRNLVAVDVKPKQIYIYERFRDQMEAVKYERYVPDGVTIQAAEGSRNQMSGYDPRTYVEVDFFGEEDTRSNLIRLVSERFTKIINVPNMKDHGAAGVTGCLKNIAYGNFSNVARSHRNEKTNTFSFIGELAKVEPVRSRTVLQVMDGLRGVWHGGPFSPTRKFRFYPGQMMFGTDPVAIDRLLIDVIDGKRKAEGATSVWDRSMANVQRGRGYSDNPNIQRFIREPGHIEYASKLGLGVYDRSKIRLKEISL